MTNETRQARPKVSAVVIARNEAATIGALLRSIFAERHLVDQVVVVDSASMDATVELSRGFPVEIVRLRPGSRLTAAAARYVGFHRTDGDLVLFVDGDMELERGWLGPAIQAIAADERIAGVTGIVVGPGEGRPQSSRGSSVTRLTCRDVGGIGLYRRAAMDRAGTFDPSLFSDEEPELCLRLERRGFHLVRLEVPAAIHHGVAPRTFAALRARRRRRLFLGYGQIVRAHRSSGRVLFRYLRFRGYGVAPVLFVAAGLGCVIWLGVDGDRRPLGVWGGALAVTVCLDAIRKRSLYHAFYSLVNRGFILEGIVRGLTLPPVDAEDVLARVERVA
jgi:glycosyltransferase involved in cell wall biosynthesis